MAKEKKPRSKPLAWLLSSTKEQAKDTGMAMVLICLLLGSWGKFPKFLPVSVALLLITMIWPNAFRPLATLWFGLSHVMSSVVSRVILISAVLPGCHPHRPHPPLDRRRRHAIEKMETGPGLGLHRP